MSRSRFHSNTSLALALALAQVGGGCSDDTCGTHGAAAVGLTVSSDLVTLTYGNLSALPGNDCPAPDAPAGVISLSLEGNQTDGTGIITVCIPRPDLLNGGMRTLGTAISTADLRLIDLQGSYNNCTFTIDTAQAPTGQGGSEGVCANGTDAAGFALEIDGAISMRRTCAATIDSVPVAIRGRVAVTKRAQ